jgi:hypothetical protein
MVALKVLIKKNPSPEVVRRKKKKRSGNMYEFKLWPSPH